MFKIERKKSLEIKTQKLKMQTEFVVDLNHRLRVRSNFEVAIKDRLNHPKDHVKYDTVENVAKRVAFELEESCYKATKSGGYFSYQNIISEFFLHICPYFKSARHSMVFRDMIIGYKMTAADGSIPDSINIAKKSKQYLWPELFDNKYLSREQRIFVLQLRQLEFGIVVNLVEKIDSSKELVFVPNEIAQSQTDVCFGKSNECWATPEPKLNVKCLLSDTCDKKEISTCMQYEDFLMHFAQNGMLGNVADPIDPKKKLKPEIAENIRKVWNTELKMTRVYLEILAEIDS
jgi:hypothetical protein